MELPFLIWLDKRKKQIFKKVTKERKETIEVSFKSSDEVLPCRFLYQYK